MVHVGYSEVRKINVLPVNLAVFLGPMILASLTSYIVAVDTRCALQVRPFTVLHLWCMNLLTSLLTLIPYTNSMYRRLHIGGILKLGRAFRLRFFLL